MSEKQDKAPEQISVWEKWKIISTSISVLLIPIVIAFIANMYSQSMKDAELKIKYLDLAIKILQEEPKPENENIRTWAVKLINEHSEVKLNESTENGLIKEYRLTVPLAAIGVRG